MIYNIISKLESTSSRNEKLEILKSNKDVVGLKEFFVAALDPFATYNIKKIPAYSNGVDTDLVSAIKKLDKLKNREVTGNAGIEYLKDILSSLDSENANLIERIIQKDPACGVLNKTVNSVWKKAITEYPVLLCSAYSADLISDLMKESEVYSQVKYDGARCNLIVENGMVTAFSRAGREIDVKDRFDSLIGIADGMMIDGELLAIDSNGKFLERKIGNGIVNKAIKNTISQKEVDSLVLVAWDIVDLNSFKSGKSTKLYESRFSELRKITDKVDCVKLSETHVCTSVEEIKQQYDTARSLGNEGIIVKSKNTVWDGTRSKQQIKFKAEIVSTMRVVDFKYGNGQFENLMGALICESDDGKVSVSVGGGWSIEQRAQVTADYTQTSVEYEKMTGGIKSFVKVEPTKTNPIGQLIEVLHNGIIESDGKFSLYLPRALDGEYRLDKETADTQEEISKQQ